MTLDEIAAILQTGQHRLQCEAPGHNGFYQYTKLVYQIVYVDGMFGIICFAGNANPTEFQLWSAQYETLAELEREQPFDLNRFRIE